MTYQLVTPQTNFLLIHARAEDEKALDMPDLIKVKQMLPAGWGGVGSADRHDVCYSMRSSSSIIMKCVDTAMSYDLDLIPSKRRSKASNSSDTGRLYASINRADQDTEYLDVPAFLRRSETKEKHPEIVLDDEHPVTLVAALISQPKEAWPQLLRDLQSIGVAPELVEWLRKEGKNPKWKHLTETIIITSFLETLISMPIFASLHPDDVKAKGPLRQWISKVWPNDSSTRDLIDPSLVRYFSKELFGISKNEWPTRISGLFIDVF